jgi:phage terminase large subunit-like protein
MKKSEQEISDAMEDIIAKHKANIAKLGFTVQAVLGDEETPPYVYTIGLSRSLKHPEVFLVGMHPQHAMGMISDIVSMIKDGSRFDQPVFAAGIIPGYEIPFRPIAEEDVLDHSAMGLELIGPFDAVQMFYPDHDGHVPWEDECEEAYRGQLFFDIEGEAPVRNITLEEARALVPEPTPLTEEQIAENRRRIIAERRKEMAEYGFVPQAVGGSEDQPSFLYTIGLTETWNHPELFVVALNPQQAYEIVADFVERIDDGERFDAPAFVSDILTVPVAVRPLEQEAVNNNSGIAQDMLGRTISAVQVYWPDKTGLMPWEDGCDPESAAVQLSIFTPAGEEPARNAAPPTASLH